VTWPLWFGYSGRDKNVPNISPRTPVTSYNQPMKPAKVLSLICALLLIGTPAWADYPIEVIELKSRPLSEILPVIRPLLGEDGTATGMGNNLVLKASPQQVREVRKLLQEIDRPPRRLLITVSAGAGSMLGSSGYSAGADIKTGNGEISINSPRHAGDDSRAHVYIQDSSGRRTSSAGQKVQALEGHPAFIASGTSIPYPGVERYTVNGQVLERTVTRSYNTGSGFYVVPRVSGDFVTLEIRQRNDQPGMRGGVIDTQRANTVVRGRLGEWISLGGVNTTSSSSRGGLGRSQTTRGSVVQQVGVMVECLDCK
jgi:hypothetical protein